MTKTSCPFSRIEPVTKKQLCYPFNANLTRLAHLLKLFKQSHNTLPLYQCLADAIKAEGFQMK